jgi:sugar lactone lactonase YvrE
MTASRPTKYQRLCFRTLLCVFVTVIEAQQVVTRLAGSGVAGYTDGTGIAAKFSACVGIAASPDSSTLFIGDQNNNLIRAVVISSAAVTVLAGGGSAGGVASGYVDGIGTAAKFTSPRGVTSNGVSLFISDFGNNLIRSVVVSSRVVTLLAGGGGGTLAGYADGIGTAAKFSSPYGIVLSLDSTTLYVCDAVNNLLRAVNIASRMVTLLAGGGSAGGTASGYVDSVGTAAKFYNPSGIVVSVDGASLYFTDDNNLLKQVVIATRTVSTVAGGGSTGGTLAGFADGIGVSLLHHGCTKILSQSTHTHLPLDCCCPQTAAKFSNPDGIALNSDGTAIIVADFGNNNIRSVNIATRMVTVLVGGGSAGGTASGLVDGTGVSRRTRF